MQYNGGKGNCYHHIINQLPPHDLYIEPFLGGGAVLLNKKPARRTIGVEIDPKTLTLWKGDEVPSLELVNMCGINFLRAFRYAYPFTGRELVYLDPPYVRSARDSKDKMYSFEFTDEQHQELLEVIKTLPSMVAISGYQSELYSHALADWRSISFQSIKRNGKMGTEILWMNYPEPFELHDYSCLGDGFRQREQITRQQRRWRAKLEGMPQQRRYALLSVLEELKAGDRSSLD